MYRLLHAFNFLLYSYGQNFPYSFEEAKIENFPISFSLVNYIYIYILVEENEFKSSIIVLAIRQTLYLKTDGRSAVCFVSIIEICYKNHLKILKFILKLY